MKTKIAMIVLLGLSFAVKAQDDTVNGNLTVNGNIKVAGTSSNPINVLEADDNFFNINLLTGLSMAKVIEATIADGINLHLPLTAQQAVFNGSFKVVSPSPNPINIIEVEDSFLKFNLRSGLTTQKVFEATNSGINLHLPTTVTKKAIFNSNVGIGTSLPNSKLHINYNTSAGDISKNGIIVTRPTTATADVKSHDKAIYAHAGYFSVAPGVTDSGYKIGVDASSYSVKTEFQGTLKTNYGLWARAGIYVASSGARINNAVAVEAQVLDNVEGTTIDNVYGVRINTGAYNKATVTNRYDLYAATTNAKNYLAGNVGIGTTSPDEKLEVSGNILSSGTMSLGKSGTSNELRDVISLYGNRLGATDMYGFGVESDGTLYNKAVAHHRWYLNSNANLGTSAKMELDNNRLFVNNNVGIGTGDTKGYNLAVAGSTGIVAEKVTVKLQSAWPDYVFANDYQLPTLEEVEEQIKEKGHLANIPSAREVQENGVELGDMNKKLLEKVEELTLYTIQQEKEIKKLKEENKKLKSLEERLAKLEALLQNK